MERFKSSALEELQWPQLLCGNSTGEEIISAGLMALEEAWQDMVVQGPLAVKLSERGDVARSLWSSSHRLEGSHRRTSTEE